MDLSVLINVGAVIVSISAVVASSRIARHQFRAQRHGNHVEPLIDLLKEFRSLEFHRSYAFIRDELPKLPSDKGISGLDDDVQRKIYDIGYFFQLYAILAHLDIIDRRFVSTLLHRRYVETWRSLRPFVHKERELQGLPEGTILNILEHFAADLLARPPANMRTLLAQGRRR
ncbi:hypothetical protein ACFFV7_34150 [Nonomuraea spiralis]|uniref:Uncharacterized protein n=1 Tax=Nonomuraea spiralis TaxID=46182 RepID=A0ABV5IP13_9ACTN|nr:hypothetical protein [Nonomuraea spiralis]GGT26874.1 hypothetical protein GCM10010176_084460 [Nonomuraea spiralis]